MVDPNTYIKDDNEKSLINDISTLSYSDNTIFSSTTPYLNNKDTLSTIYTPSLRAKEKFSENPNLYLQNITPPFSTKVSPLVISKSELSSDELTNSLNKIKANSINDYSYIVGSVASNSNIPYIEGDKKIINKNMLNKKSFSYSLGDSNKLIPSENLNNISTSAPTPLDLLNFNSSKSETIGGISPITTHPTIFKQNGNELYTMPLTLNNNRFTIQSPQYKSTVTLPLTPLSSRSISSSYS